MNVGGPGGGVDRVGTRLVSSQTESVNASPSVLGAGRGAGVSMFYLSQHFCYLVYCTNTSFIHILI